MSNSNRPYNTEKDMDSCLEAVESYLLDPQVHRNAMKVALATGGMFSIYAGLEYGSPVNATTGATFGLTGTALMEDLDRDEPYTQQAAERIYDRIDQETDIVDTGRDIYDSIEETYRSLVREE